MSFHKCNGHINHGKRTRTYVQHHEQFKTAFFLTELDNRQSKWEQTQRVIKVFEMGYNSAEVLAGGVMAWLAARYPVVSPE
jgi:ATP/ADP translocase